MNKPTSVVLFTLAIAFTSSSVFADRVVASYNCQLKEGKKQEELHTVNSKWLKFVRANVNEKITSEVGTAIVGKQDIFIFVDTYPDLNTWAAAQTALDSDAASGLEDLFDEVSECTENKLWKFVATK